MVLNVDTDAAYLVLPQARSHIAGHYFLSDNPPAPPTMPKPNGPIHTECRRLRGVVSSAAEAECGGLYHNSQNVIPIRDSLIAIGHPQPPTPIKTDNSTALGIVTSLTKPKCSKTWDMLYHWIEDRVHMGHLRPYWDKGINTIHLFQNGLGIVTPRNQSRIKDVPFFRTVGSWSFRHYTRRHADET
jgi:hypothetical protein